VWYETVLKAQGEWVVSFAGSRYLKSQNVFDALGSEIDRLLQTPDNWNSYGSPAPSELAVKNTYPILQALRVKLVQPERVLPSADGGVAFIFVSDTISRAAIESLNGGNSHVLLYDLDGNSETIEWPTAQDAQLNLVSKLAAHLRSDGLATKGE
jgi:hypothetical protein